MVVVAAVDRSSRRDTVVDEAVDLAEAYDLPLHVVHVMSSEEFIERERTEYEETGESIPVDEIRAEASHVAEEAVGAVGHETEFVGLVGDASNEIIEYADSVDARYIVVGPRKRSPAGKALFGSVGQSILLNAERPVVSILS